MIRLVAAPACIPTLRRAVLPHSLAHTGHMFFLSFFLFFFIIQCVCVYTSAGASEAREARTLELESQAV